MRNPIIRPHPHEIRRPDNKPKAAIQTDVSKATKSNKAARPPNNLYNERILLRDMKNMKKKTRYIVSHEYVGKVSMRSAFEQLIEIGVHDLLSNASPVNTDE